MALTAFIDTATPNCIHGSGQVIVGQFRNCTWTTPNGSTAVLVVTNTSASQLSVVISGAPMEIFAADGSPLNGRHVLPPNVPTANVTAIGDFRGQNVTLFNISTPAANAQVTTSVAEPC